MYYHTATVIFSRMLSVAGLILVTTVSGIATYVLEMSVRLVVFIKHVNNTWYIIHDDDVDM